MPRDASGTYSKAPGTTAAPNTVIGSAQFNSTIDDIVTDANTARPVVAGGTGASTTATARSNLGVALAQTSTTDTTAASGLIVGGFGIGGVGISPTGDDLDGALYTGFYRVISTTANTPAGTGPTGCSCIVTRYDDDDIQQIFVYRGTTTADVRIYVRHMRAGTWGAWKSANSSEGSTANGYYIKHDSGWVEMFSAGLTFTRAANTRAEVTWTLPTTLVASPQARFWLAGLSTDSADYTGDITVNAISGLQYNHAASITASVDLRLYATTGTTWTSGTARDVYVCGMGRWL